MAKESAELVVLVVADEFLMRWAIAESLMESGHAVVQAVDGAGAIHALTEASSPIDVVILDYQLAGSDGVAVLASVRRIVPLTPVVVITADGSPEVTLEALQLGACQVVVKPFDMNDLASMVHRAYGQRPH
jgi:two-component system, NtrC family, response regulator AtoC